jgi:hypothetical protein
MFDFSRFTELGDARKGFLAGAFEFPFQPPRDAWGQKEWERGAKLADSLNLVGLLAGIGVGIGGPPSEAPALVRGREGGGESPAVGIREMSPPALMTSKEGQNGANETSKKLADTQSESDGKSADLKGASVDNPGGETNWGKGNQVGRIAEVKLHNELPGEKIFGNMPNMDRVIYSPEGPAAPAKEVGQLKTYNTTTKSYINRPNHLYNRIITDAGELAAIGESSWEHGGYQVEIGPDTQRVLDVVIPEKPLTEAQQSALDSAVTASASMKVEVRVHRLP